MFFKYPNKLIQAVLNKLGYQIQKIHLSENIDQPNLLPLQFQDELHCLDLNQVELASLKFFRTYRYDYLNELRWRLFLQTGILIEGRTIFEPGAGIGDQTQWLLQRGASKIIVSEGRETNIGVIKKRFNGDSRVIPMLGNLEECLDQANFRLKADLIFLWGVYYHINDPMPSFPILKQLANIAPIIALDYLESITGSDYIEAYDYENPSASIGHASGRQTPSSMIEALRSSYGHVYYPIEQMNWHDPSAPMTPRKIIIGSVSPLKYQGLIEAK
jgi:hypothetical protein